MKIKLLVAAIIFACFNAQAADLSSSGYGIQTVRTQGTAIKGEVIDIRKINIDPSNNASNVGKIAGAVIGGAAGAGVAGNNNFARIAVGALGGLVGGVAGDKITDKIANQSGVEVIVATEKGDALVVIQSVSDGSTFVIGDNVWVIKSGNSVRVTKRANP